MTDFVGIAWLPGRKVTESRTNKHRLRVDLTLEGLMNVVKSLLLSSAAGFLAAAGAQAADLPSRKAAPVEYVRVCSAYGAGFFYIPGTETCLRVGGYVRAEYQYTPGKDVYSTTGL